MNTLTAIIWGSTGLIGSELKRIFDKDPRYGNIICSVRKKSMNSPLETGKITEKVYSLVTAIGSDAKSPIFYN